jgi:hypothetical protein
MDKTLEGGGGGGGKLRFFILKRRVRIRGLRSEFQVKTPDLVPDPPQLTTKCCKKIIDIFVAVQIPFGLRKKTARYWILRGGSGSGFSAKKFLVPGQCPNDHK